MWALFGIPITRASKSYCLSTGLTKSCIAQDVSITLKRSFSGVDDEKRRCR